MVTTKTFPAVGGVVPGVLPAQNGRQEDKGLIRCVLSLSIHTTLRCG